MKSPLSKIVTLTLLLTIMGFKEIQAADKGYGYISPGIHFGYAGGEGFFWGLQITGGVFVPPVSVGTSFGVRRYWGKNEYYMKYRDFQMGYFVIGVGAGQSKYRVAGDDEWKTAERYKVWAGSLGLLTYDYTILEEAEHLHNWGLMGVFPLSSYANEIP